MEYHEILLAIFVLKKNEITVEKKLQSVGRGDYELFKKGLSAIGVPDAICDLLFEKYVVEAIVMEAVEKYPFLNKIRGLIKEVFSDMEDHEILLAIFVLKKNEIIREKKLQNVGRGDYELFKKGLSAMGVPDAICDLLFENYVSKSRSAVIMNAVGFPPLAHKSITVSSPHIDKARKVAKMNFEEIEFGIISGLRTNPTPYKSLWEYFCGGCRSEGFTSWK